jgi:TonB family protein
MSDALAASVFARAVGLALVEFLWQGAAIGAVSACLLFVLRRASAQARYLVACGSLVLMAAMPVVGAIGHMREPGGRAASAVAGAAPKTSFDRTDLGASSTPPAPASWLSRDWLEPRLPLVVLIWSAGVLVLGLHLFHGWLRVGRIRRRAMPLASDRWPEAVRLLACRLGVVRRLQLLESSLVDVPAVIGFLRPAIVVPASVLAGLPPAHLEAILAHELAHVRRADYLLNAAQCVIEVLLFYHPAVWWVSRQIRIEREHCCDDLAAAVCADRVAYAHALVSMEELRGRAPALAMAATGGQLLTRIRRLLDPGSVRGPRLSGGLAMAVMLTVLMIAVSGHIEGTPVLGVAVDRLAQVARDATVPAAPAVQDGKVPMQQTQAVVAPASQSRRGLLSGVVRDQDGRVLVAAPVVATAVSGGDSRTTETNGRGEFVLPDLAPGTYDVTITRAGFKTFKGRLTIVSSESVRTNVQLEIGSLAETISVRSLPGPRPVSPAPIAQTPSDPRTAADYFDMAKSYYQQGRLADAEAMTLRALELLRAASAESPKQLPVIRSLLEQSAPDPGGPVRVGGEVVPPVRTNYVEPVYPEIAKTAGVQGVVYIEARIGKDGSVIDAKVVRGIPLLNDAALDAVRQWVFSPTKLNGAPVEIVMTVTVRFSQ